MQTVHVVSRFIDRDWFFHDDEERQHYLRLLGIALDQSDWRLLAYALMTHDIQLAMIGNGASLVAWVNRINSSFARWMNERHERKGPVLDRRPKHVPIAEPEEAALLAQIHNQPVLAGVVACARDSAWTSHRAYLGEVVTPNWLHVDEGLARAGLDATTFEWWVDRSARYSDHDDLDPPTTVRSYAVAVRSGASPLRACDRGSPSIDHPDLAMVLHIVEGMTGVPSSRLRHPTAVPAVVAARKLCVRSALALGIPARALVDVLGVNPLDNEPTTSAERALIEIVVQRLSVSA